MDGKKRSWIILALVVVLFLAAAGFVLRQRLQADRSVSYDYWADVASVEDFTKVLRVAGGSDFSPFAYLDENGLPCGHDVELAFALGRELGCRVEVTLGDWGEMQAGLLDGTYDLLLTVDFSDERSRLMGYTTPVCLDSYVFFGRGDELDLSSVDSLQTVRIAALDGGGATDNYLKPLGLLDNTRFYQTQAEAFHAVAAGESDVAIAGYIYGSNIIANLGLPLQQMGTPLYGTAYYITYSNQNRELGNRVNAALADLSTGGELKKIDDKWTVHYQPNLSLRDYLKQNRQKVLLVCLSALVLLGLLVVVSLVRKRRREQGIMERNSLTGLYHMRAFLQRMGALLQKRDGRDYVLIRFDIDNFKAFNSMQGTEAGDQLLAAIGSGLLKLQKSRQDILLIGYLGNDHFAALTLRDSQDSDPDTVYKTLVSLVEKACPGYYLAIRMGLCEVADGAGDLGQLCDYALLALRSVKNDFYRHWAWFDESARIQLAKEQNITGRMYQALEDGEFVPYFQPQMNYETGKLCGAEALVRWVGKDGKLVSPADFVPLFEKNGFIYEMDKAVWRSVCRCIRRWREEGLQPPPISVNISRTDIFHSDLVDTIADIVWQENCCMEELHLEITESAYMENSNLLIDTVRRFHLLGARVEIDDFGSGYSTLATLKDMDFDTMKLDMSLLRNNSLSGKHAALLKAIVSLGQDMGMGLIAEGVERQEQADYLHSLGCNVMQGYLYAKPMSQRDFEKLLRAQRDEAAGTVGG